MVDRYTRLPSQFRNDPIMARIPKVLVVTTIYSGKEYCLERFLTHARGLTYPNMRHVWIDNSADDGAFAKKLVEEYDIPAEDVYHIERGSNSREALARSSNYGRKLVIEGGYDYMFMLESDVMVPPTIIERLVSYGKDIISGLYMIGSDEWDEEEVPEAYKDMVGTRMRWPCVTIPRYNHNLGAWGSRLLTLEEVNDYVMQGVKRVHTNSFGNCLIHKSVFTKHGITFTYDPRFNGHPDIYFFNNCFMKRIPVFVDTSVVSDHDNIPWSTVEDR